MRAGTKELWLRDGLFQLNGGEALRQITSLIKAPRASRDNKKFRGILTLFMFLCTLALARASPGDSAPLFRGCLFHCLEGSGAAWTPRPAQCGRDPPGGDLPDERPRTLRWDCASECRYQCMRAAEAAAEESRPHKYYGKWPFRRVLRCQELVSVLASLANLAVHVRAVMGLLSARRQLRRRARRSRSGPSIPDASRPAVRRLNLPSEALGWDRFPDPAAQALSRCDGYLLHSALSVLSWAASAVFHARDVPATERWDYFLAGAVVALGVLVTVARTVGPVRRSRSAQGALALALALAYGARVRSMLVVQFDYGGWVAACLLLGLLQTALWLRWLYRDPEGRRHRGRADLLLFIGLLNLASALEILDFAPILWDLVDAHAVWHLATVFLWRFWYEFVRKDLQGDVYA